MYTLNTPVEQAQHIAYSHDGGYTFTKYSANPVISVGSTEFRDPKVFWHAPTSRWVVVVAFAQEYVIGIWTSPNLREWTHASNFTHGGLLGLQYECPSLVPIPMLKNGSKPLPELLDSSNTVGDADIWLMFISINPGAPLGGSTSQYIPGHFNGTHFNSLDGAARLADFSKDNYAGQFFAEIPTNEPQISIQWASNWQYANNVPTDSEGFRGAMALPRMHVLANTTRTPYALFSIPVPFTSLRTAEAPLLQDDKLANTTFELEYAPINSSGALTFSMTAQGLPKKPQGSLNFTILSSATGEQIRGGFLMEGDSTFFLDRSGVHGFKSPYFTGQFSAAHPIDQDTRHFRMDVVIDRSMIEVFLDNGVRSATALYFSTGRMDTLSLGSGELDDDVRVEAEVWGLQSVWSADSGDVHGNLSQIVQDKFMGNILNR
jgi:beta-fructofuranosidase